MTRNTQSNKILYSSMIFSINISPLNTSSISLRASTVRTFLWDSFLPPYPLMKTTIANCLTFPSIVSLTGIFPKCFKSLRPYLTPILSGNSVRLTTLQQILNRQFRLAFTRTARSLTYFGKRFELLGATYNASNLYHLSILSLFGRNAI